jgi:glycosyltransferase involved in cell wall biosynthesis
MAYFHEPEQGVSAARNRGMKEACGDYVGFLDDECVVRSNWLEIVVADIDEFAPFIIGGPYIGALLPGTVPKWFKIEYGNAYFLADNFERGYQKEFRASSGNMFFHRRVCESYKFDVNFSMKGHELKLGAETLLQERFLSENKGALIFYEPGIEVAHYILPQKMSLSYHSRRLMESGASASSYEVRSASLSFEVVSALAHLCVSPLRTIFRDRSRYPYWQNYAYEKVIPRVMPAIGPGLEKLRGRYQ